MSFGPDPVAPAEYAEFHVVMAYEDFDTGHRAMEVYHELLQKLGRMYLFNHHAWKLTVLRNTKMQALAVDDAARADLIIISAHGTGDLPVELRDWVEKWVPEKKRSPSLLVVLDDTHTESGSAPDRELHAYFEAVAQRAHMDFFCASLSPLEDDLEHLEDPGYSGQDLGIGTGEPTIRWDLNE